ncbi:hypothetical protein EXS74_01025 [Candidatus Woesearchaeota archaeon]|nr:hypothetical protein [Candidatus Woesearchaeota archaeon]
MELKLEELRLLQRMLHTTGAPLEQSIWRYLDRDVFVLLSGEDIQGAYFSQVYAEEKLQAERRLNRDGYSLLHGSFQNLENGDFSGVVFDSLDRGEIYGHLERYLLENSL